MCSWLSVGKSYKASVPVDETAVSIHLTGEQSQAIGDVAATSNRKRVTNDELPSDEDRHRKKYKKDKEKKPKDKKSNKKKDKKSKKEHKHTSRSSTALVPHTSNSRHIPKPSADIDISSSDSDFSSSEEEAEFNSTRRIIRENKAEIMSGHSELTFLPNGEVVLLPKFALADNSVSWNVDRRKDNSLLLYDNLPSDVVYTIHQGAKYYTTLSQLPAHSAHYGNTTATTTDASTAYTTSTIATTTNKQSALNATYHRAFPAVDFNFYEPDFSVSSGSSTGTSGSR